MTDQYYSAALDHQLAALRLCESDIGQQTIRALITDRQWVGNPVDLNNTATQTIQNLIGCLRYGDTYFIDPMICGVLESSAEGIPDNWVPTRESWPSRVGFAWFGKSLHLPGHPEHDILDMDIAGLTWARLPGNTTTWLSVLMDMHGRPVPLGMLQWPDGAPISEIDDTRTDDGDEIRGKRFQVKFRYVAALLAFLEQRIVVSRPAQAERHTRKRTQDFIQSQVIRIVELRRKEHVADGHTVEVMQRDWACQWVVRGHWRQQFYPSKHTNQPLWITPYVKGPENKPLKPPRTTIFAVVR